MHRSLCRFLNPITSEIVSNLSKITPVLTSDIAKYTTEWLGRKSDGRAVVRPKSTEQISNIIKICHDGDIGVTVVGGNTGLAGGTLSGKDELIISLEKLDQVLHVDPVSCIATVESGVILERLQQELSGYSLTTPYDLGARGSCTVGGNLATHAGGQNFVKYGPLRAHVLGLEIVLPDGKVLDLMSTSRKDNTGIDLKQLFIGSEGCLGIITKANIHCPILPQYKSVALMSAFSTFSEFVLPSLSLARLHLGDSLSAFEFIDKAGLSVLPPLPSGGTASEFAIVVEASGVSSVEDGMSNFIETVASMCDGVVASDLEGCKKLWHYRESLPVILGSAGHNIKFDVSLPLDQYYDLVEGVRAKFGSQTKHVVGYGHVADGNLHLNVVLDNPGPMEKKIADYVYARIVGGSVSAEHGIGRDKLSRVVKPPTALFLSRSIKHLFDPRGIMNPGRTIV